MRPSLGGFVAWATAFVAVFSFYAHAAFQLPSTVVTPVSALAIAAGLGLMALMGLLGGTITRSSGAARQASVLCLAGAVALMVISQSLGYARRGMGFNDWGLFAVEAGLPVLLLLNPRRLELLTGMAVCCVGFALLDLGANVLTMTGAAHLVQQAGTAGSASYGVHYLGLAGNSDAEGVVAFVAAVFLASGLRSGSRLGRFLRLAVIAALMVSLYLIGARRYFGMAIVAVPLLAFDGARRIPLNLVVAAFAGLFLTATFNAPSGDFTNHLRAELMQSGAADALKQPLIGKGVFYRNTSELEAVYDQLRGAGVTESGALDLAVAYGIPATSLFLLASVCVLGARRERYTWPIVMLAMLTAELAFGDDLTGFPGAILYYGALIWGQREEGWGDRGD